MTFFLQPELPSRVQVPHERYAVIAPPEHCACMQALQCVPILGIFGIVDMVSNVVGFAFGFCAADPAVEHGLHVT